MESKRGASEVLPRQGAFGERSASAPALRIRALRSAVEDGGPGWSTRVLSTGLEAPHTRRKSVPGEYGELPSTEVVV